MAKGMFVWVCISSLARKRLRIFLEIDDHYCACIKFFATHTRLTQLLITITMRYLYSAPYNNGQWR